MNVTQPGHRRSAPLSGRLLRPEARAARLGHPETQAMLGAACLAGKGIERDVVEALHWLRRAEMGGAGELAAGFLKEARAHARPSQRAEGERRAEEPLR